MDSSLKQRLLGATVLIALAVIFVPMFISGTAPPESSEMQTRDLEIPPAPEREFQERVLPVDVPSVAPPAPEGPPASAPTAVDAPVPSPASSSPLPEAAPAPANPAPPPAKPPSVKPAAAATEAPPAGVAASGRWLVHLGVYANTANARDLVAKLKKAGYPAFVEDAVANGKPAERVRVGPYASRAAAEAARLRIRGAHPDVPGSVIENAARATADAPASALPAARAGAWVVQLGALKSEADANKLRDRARNAGFPSFVDRVTADGVTLWRVRVGPEVDRAAADRMRAQVRDKLKIDGMVLTQ